MTGRCRSWSMRSATWSPCTTTCFELPPDTLADRYPASDQGRLQARRCLAAGPGPRPHLGHHDLTRGNRWTTRDEPARDDTARPASKRRRPACTSTGRWAARSPRSACRGPARDAARDGHGPVRDPDLEVRQRPPGGHRQRGARRDAGRHAARCLARRRLPGAARGRRERAAGRRLPPRSRTPRISGRPSRSPARSSDASEISTLGQALSQADNYAPERDRARRHRRQPTVRPR